MNYLHEIGIHVRQTTMGKIVPELCRRSALHFGYQDDSGRDHHPGWLYAVAFLSDERDEVNVETRFMRDDFKLQIVPEWIEFYYPTDSWEIWVLDHNDDPMFVTSLPVWGCRNRIAAKECARAEGYMI